MFYKNKNIQAVFTMIISSSISAGCTSPTTPASPSDSTTACTPSKVKIKEKPITAVIKN